MNPPPNSETKYFHQKNDTKTFIKPFITSLIHEVIQYQAEDKSQRIFFYSPR